ncbi:MAG: metallophosphoesterase [Spirochaetales bacterium]|nr:metallophosphoesterase [Spirochaetales bacterium]
MKRMIQMLCVADEIDLLVYSPSIRERFGDADLVLSAGDLPDEYLEYIASMLNRPVIAVAGNHDAPDDPISAVRFSPRRFGTRLERTHFRIKTESGVSILGIPGCIRYNKGGNQFTDAGMTWKLLKLVPLLLLRRLLYGRAVDVVLAHAPPRGIHDGGDQAHKGFSAFLWLMRIARPAYFVHGHVHLYDAQELREQRFGDTIVVNVYGHRVLTLEKEYRNVP